MGSDDLFHKRKAKRVEAHRRKMARRDPYERILIVCEGAKTEPNYFNWFRKELGLNKENIVIDIRKTGLDPLSLVEHAINTFNKESDFEHVYCVFDRDKHATYEAALDKIRAVRMKGKAKIHPITSIPCFEFWLLLHFEYTTRQYEAPLDASNGDLVVANLKEHIPDYQKGSSDFRYIDGKTADAIDRAKRIERYQETSGTENPSTKVYQLVEYLMGLKR